MPSLAKNSSNPRTRSNNLDRSPEPRVQMEALLDAAIGRSGRVRISASAVRQHSWANWISGV